MAGRKKHAERSHKTNSVRTDLRGFGLNRMASIVDRGSQIRKNRARQRKGVA